MNKKSSIDIDALKHWKKCSPEAKFQWLADALEFAHAKKQIIKPSKQNRFS